MESNRRRDLSDPADPETSIPLSVLPLHSTNLLTVLDENGVIRYESPSIERLYGYEQDELVGDAVADYFHPDDRERVVGAFEAVVGSESYTVEAVEYRHEQADGTYVWVESVAAADPTPNGNYVVNTRDISARKEREQQLEETNERLEAFASIVSHDLRNPLNVAQLRLALAREECDSDHLGDVANAHERMETLVEDLLTLSRAGTGATDVSTVHLSRLADACWQMVATGDATLETDVDRTVRGDRNRLQQLLENLIRNAVEHGPTSPDSHTRQDAVDGSTSPDSHTRQDAVTNGDDSITITVGELDDGFYIEDDGTGIPPGDRTDVFDVGATSMENGTGLGLSIVEQIVTAHGWDVRVTDGVDGGARFEITGVAFVD